MQHILLTLTALLGITTALAAQDAAPIFPGFPKLESKATGEWWNVKEKNLKNLLKQVPSLKKPTISPLSEKGWYGVNTVILKSEFYKLVPKLRRIAQGLVVHEPRQILQLEEIKRDEEN